MSVSLALMIQAFVGVGGALVCFLAMLAYRLDVAIPVILKRGAVALLIFAGLSFIASAWAGVLTS